VQDIVLQDMVYSTSMLEEEEDKEKLEKGIKEAII
jgi:hypothetical protein